MMEYTAAFEINCGISNGHVVSPDCYKKNESITAKTSQEAISTLLENATYLLKEHMCNPVTGLVKITLLSLTDFNGNNITPTSLEECQNYSVAFENNHPVFQRRSIGAILFGKS